MSLSTSFKVLLFSILLLRLLPFLPLFLFLLHHCLHFRRHLPRVAREFNHRKRQWRSWRTYILRSTYKCFFLYYLHLPFRNAFPWLFLVSFRSWRELCSEQSENCVRLCSVPFSGASCLLPSPFSLLPPLHLSNFIYIAKRSQASLS